jgi:hypothetical protein
MEATPERDEILDYQKLISWVMKGQEIIKKYSSRRWYVNLKTKKYLNINC